jgi:methionyl-tRNA formyltransferase
VRVLFAGTPETALPSLQALLDSPHDVVGVLTRPDAPSGRHRRRRASPVAEVARGLGLPVLTPTSTTDPALARDIAGLRPQVAAVVAYGNLLRPALLQIPPHGWINLHFSLLPAWRGAAPVQHAIMAGDEITGATTFRLEEGLDTGPMVGTLTERVRPDDTAGSLLSRLSDAGASLLVASLDAVESGRAQLQQQPQSGVSHAPKLSARDAEVRWSKPAFAVDRQVRGCTPSPGAHTSWRGTRLNLQPVQLPEAATGSEAAPDLSPGEVQAGKREVWVGTGTTAVRLGAVQPPGKAFVPAADWARGARPAAGERFGEGP